MNKRGNGEGNVRLHDDGRRQASTLVAATDGTRKRHYVYGASRAEAQDKLDDIRQRVRGGQPAVDSGVTLSAYLDGWLVDGLTEHKAATRENYTTMVRKHITPAIGSVRLDRLSPLDVQSLVNAKRATQRLDSQTDLLRPAPGARAGGRVGAHGAQPRSQGQAPTSRGAA